MTGLYKRLTEDHEFLPFDCGDQDLNEFLLKDAMDYQRGLFAVTYFVDNDEDTIIYFSLSNDKLSAVEMSKAVPFYLHNDFIFIGREEQDRYEAEKDDPECKGTYAMYFDLSSMLKP